ncbi:SURF1 family protein [Cognatilysobacter bugurensis]|uniref:SURF1-like protein n=1 Tax=Cognatilysobacter bugurensis TaxID=543356 RepID=A0A918SVM2_9GAMM|nr:SURF1 family cytochrome oxidase biogenesis protein [Lysobacter bugurensis]GHA73266.1 hypothetical protein GCM10007067_07410 [Lysobacter bugurensis]
MSPTAVRERTPPSRGRWFAVLAVALAVAGAAFVALGIWQLQRMQWKRELIERVESRVGAPPVAMPARARWPAVDAEGHEYQRAQVSGEYLPGAEVRTQALTELGAGSWVLTALRTGQGDIVFVNRGFVPTGAEHAAAPTGPISTTGLLRLSEPRGGFLRRNDAAAGRWYARDVQAISRALGLPAASTAPFFIDAERTGPQPDWPRAGMTVVRFRDPHLTYALTWFALAALTAWAGLRLRRLDRVDAGRRADEETDT